MARTHHSLLAGTALLLALEPAARAEVSCLLADKDVIVVDGLLDDWSDVQGARYKGADAGDASLLVRCNHDSEALYISVLATDDRLIRNRKPGKGDDRIVITLGKAKLGIYPADSAHGIPRSVSWSGSGGARVVVAAESLQKRGWSIEVGVPLGRVPGWSRGVPALPFTIDFHDADLLVEQRVQEVVTSGGDRLSFQEGSAMFKWFLDENKLRPEDVTIDVMADMDGAPGLERVVAAGRIVGVLAEEYSYLTLPVQTKKDVLAVKVVDLGGEGRSSIVAHYLERGDIGAREVLVVFTLGTDGTFSRTFAHEVAKRLGKNRITNTWSLVPRSEVDAPTRGKGKGKPKGKRGKGKGKGGGMAIVIRGGEHVGFPQDTWHESPADDMQPILLPWDERKREVWTFSGGEAFGP